MTKQTWRANQYSDHASFVSELGSPVVSLLNPIPGEHILDLGCGDGSLTEKIQRVGATVIGVDSSASMVDGARSRGITAEVMPAESLSFSNEFDAVFTNAALHWMPDYISVIRGVHHALKSGGRFVGEFGGQGNIQSLIDAMRDTFVENSDFGEFSIPWYFPNEQDYSSALESVGFYVSKIELMPRPTPLKTGIREWLKIFANYAMSTLNPEQQARFLREVEDRVKAKLYSKKNGWSADYVRLRFCASKA